MSDLETLESVAHLFNVYVKQDESAPKMPDYEAGHYACACSHSLHPQRYYFTTHIYDFDAQEKPISFVWSKTAANRAQLEKRQSPLLKSMLTYGARNAGTYQGLEAMLASRIAPALIVNHVEGTVEHRSEAKASVALRELWTPRNYERYIAQDTTGAMEIMVYHVTTQRSGTYIDPVASLELTGREPQTWDAQMWANTLRVGSPNGARFYEVKVGYNDYKKVQPIKKSRKTKVKHSSTRVHQVDPYDAPATRAAEGGARQRLVDRILENERIRREP